MSSPSKCSVLFVYLVDLVYRQKERIQLELSHLLLVSISNNVKIRLSFVIFEAHASCAVKFKFRRYISNIVAQFCLGDKNEQIWIENEHY